MNPANSGGYRFWEAALAEASRENLLIFLNLGHAGCEPVLRMDREVFSLPEVRRLLEEEYLFLDADTVARPDLSAVYLTITRCLKLGSGEPMNLILTPEGKPVLAFPYLPAEDSEAGPGLLTLLRTLSEQWKSSPAALRTMAERMLEPVRKQNRRSPGTIPENLFSAALQQLTASRDDEYGGFGTGMKFPMAGSLIWLLRYSHYRSDQDLRLLAEHSLQQMYRGGIYDHFGGAFFRCSRDREWLVPAFEKNLGENALLVLAYLEAWKDGHLVLYRRIVRETLDALLEEFASPEGGYISSHGAVSDGIDGGYYLMVPQEIRQELGEDDGRHFCECYDISDEGNFAGASIPNLLLNQRWNLLPPGYEAFRQQLRDYRRGRMPLAADTQRPLSANALLLRALAAAFKAFGTRRYLDRALSLSAFLRQEWNSSALQGTLCRTGQGAPALLDAYAFLALGELELYGADFDPERLRFAKELGEAILRLFTDPTGGYFDTPKGAEQLLFRPKTFSDGALPCGMGACAELFELLWRYTGERFWKEKAKAVEDYLFSVSPEYPAGCPSALAAAFTAQQEPRTAVLVCPTDEIPSALYVITEVHAPELSVLVKMPSTAECLAEVAPFTAALPLPTEGAVVVLRAADGTLTGPVPLGA